MEPKQYGPAPRKRNYDSINLNIRPDQIVALNYVAGENQFHSVAEAARLALDTYFVGRMQEPGFPAELAAMLREGMANG
jgi:hypothetical protein